MNEQPYLERHRTELVWNKSFDQEAECVCGHPYYRHFDSYDNMANVGCKYCGCFEFRKAQLELPL
jgi:hypothetical protein